jgi:hypothetical protein
VSGINDSDCDLCLMRPDELESCVREMFDKSKFSGNDGNGERSSNGLLFSSCLRSRINVFKYSIMAFANSVFNRLLLSSISKTRNNQNIHMTIF